MPAAPRRLATARWIFAAIAALIATWSVAHILSVARNADTAEGRRVSACVATRDLSLGERTDATACRVVAMRQRALPDDVVRHAARLDNHIAKVPVLAGTPITARHLAARDRNATDPLTPPGMRTVQVSPNDGFQPPPGAVVDVIATFVPEPGTRSVKPTVAVVARHVLVVGSARNERGTPATVLQLVVSPDQAQRLALAQRAGTVSVAVTPPEEAASPPTTGRVGTNG